MKSMMGRLFAILFYSACATALAAQDQVVRVAGDPYPPWSVGEAGAKPSGGIAFELTRELFRRMGLDTTEFIYPFKRGLQRIEDGEEDVILMVSYSEERDKFMLFSPPIREVRFVFYYPADMGDFDWGKWQDLKQYRIGAVTGYNVGDEWPKAIQTHGLKVEEVKTDIFNMKKMLAGRIDLFLTDHEVMQRTIEDNPEFQGKFKWHPRPVYESVNNLGISRKSFLASRMAEIERTMNEMKKDGTFQQVFCKYGKAYSGACG